MERLKNDAKIQEEKFEIKLKNLLLELREQHAHESAQQEAKINALKEKQKLREEEHEVKKQILVQEKSEEHREEIAKQRADNEHLKRKVELTNEGNKFKEDLGVSLILANKLPLKTEPSPSSIVKSNPAPKNQPKAQSSPPSGSQPAQSIIQQRADNTMIQQKTQVANAANEASHNYAVKKASADVTNYLTMKETLKTRKAQIKNDIQDEYNNIVQEVNEIFGNWGQFSQNWENTHAKLANAKRQAENHNREEIEIQRKEFEYNRKIEGLKQNYRDTAEKFTRQVNGGWTGNKEEYDQQLSNMRSGIEYQISSGKREIEQMKHNLRVAREENELEHRGAKLELEQHENRAKELGKRT
jgi:hypothetical protein